MSDNIAELPEERLDYFAVVGVRFRGRANTREPLDPFLRLDLLSTSAPPAELRLTFRSALELCERIMHEMGLHVQRADLNAALGRTEPLATQEVIDCERSNR